MRYRVLQVDHDGTATTHYAKSEGEAAKLVKACWIDLGIPDPEVFTVTRAVEAFIQYKKKAEAWGPRTFERTGADLRAFAAGAPDAPIECVNTEWVRSYLQRISHLALASQRSRFHAAAELLGWCVRKGYLKIDPSLAIDPVEKPWVGKRARRTMGRGKPQLRNAAEVDAYLAAATKLPRRDHRVAASLPLHCGLRSGEVRHLQVGDIDFTMGKIWVRGIDEDDDLDLDWDVKTATSQRTVDLPDELRAELEALCAGRAAHQLLFESNRNPGQAYERKWLNRMVKRVCRDAGVRVVCAHGLRDTYTSLMSALGGLSPAQVARLVGHADQGQTAKKHYIGAPEHTPALTLVQGGKARNG